MTGPEGLPGRVPGRLPLLVGLLAVAVHLPSLGNGFAYDDVPAVVEHDALHDPANLPELWTEPYWPNRFGRALGLWRPVTTTALSLQWAAFDGDPAGFHLVNTLLHGAVAVVVTLLLAQLLPVAGAVAGGVVFALHPLHVEAVANVVGVAELLSALFFLAACLLFLRRRERPGVCHVLATEGGATEEAATGGTPGGGTVLGISLLYVLAFLSKEGAAVLPAVILLLDAWADRTRLRDLGGWLRSRLTLYGALAVAGVLVLAGRHAVVGSMADPAAPLGAGVLETFPRIWTVLGVWPHYLRLLLWPAELSVDYSPAVLPVLRGWAPEAILGLALGLGALGMAWWAWREGPAPSGARAEEEAPPGSPGIGGIAGDPAPLALAVLWFAVTVLPVSNLLFLSGVLLAERTLYLPSVAVAIAAGWVVAALWPSVWARSSSQAASPDDRVAEGVEGERSADGPEGGTRVEGPGAGEAGIPLGPALLVGVALWCAWLGWRTVERIPVWESTHTVFVDLLEEHPESGRAQWFWGDVLVQQGEVEEALARYRIAARIIGLREYFFLTSVGRTLLRAGREHEGELYLRYAVNDAPAYPEAYRFLAVLYQDQERWPEAGAMARRALETGGSTRAMHHLLATALERQGAWAEAAEHRRAAIEAGEEAGWQWWVWLGRAQERGGLEEAACRSMEEALRRSPGPEVAQVVDSLRSAISLDGASGCPPPDSADPAPAGVAN